MKVHIPSKASTGMPSVAAHTPSGHYRPSTKAIVWLFCLLFTVSTACHALTVPAGTYYFDNSKLNYSSVKFVYGNDAESTTHILALTKTSDGRYSFTIDNNVTGQTHYFFTNTALPVGTTQEAVTAVKDLIVQRGEHRTQTFKDVDNAPMIPGATFVPATTDLYTSGTWQTEGNLSPHASGTLPVMYINTEGGVAITSKEDYVRATLYVDPMGTADCPASGTQDTPLALSIKGRGNWTWTGFSKKPYRLKLDAKTPLLGMTKSKHFVLMAGADDNLGCLRNPLGYELSRRMKLAWTPACRPLEVVLNGDYIGLYFLTENIRVDADRVNITEQNDNSDEDVTGGWLVEVDNYNTDPHISVTMSDKNQDMWITYKSPELLSANQESYLQQQFNAIRDAVYATDKNSTEWENLIDMYAMARLYVVRELMQDEEGFHGSFYLHKDRGADTKWVAGPVWDFGNAYNNDRHSYIWDNPQFECFLIDHIYQFPRFQEAVKNVFGDFYRDAYASMDKFIDQLASSISSAAVSDCNRWPSYGTNDEMGKAATIKSRLHEKVSWLVSQWGTDGSTGIATMQPNHNTSARHLYDLQGREVRSAQQPGIYILKNGATTSKVMIKGK